MNVIINKISKGSLRTLLPRLYILLLLCIGWTHPVESEEITVAVATNFYPLLEKLKPDYEGSSGHSLIVSYGSTGHLYAHIKNGAPYDILLAADVTRPLLLEKEGLGVAGTRFTYAIGRLALLGNAADRIMDGPGILREADFLSLAIANPELAPYGLAAQQVLIHLGIWDQLRDKIVMGENISQTYSLVHTGNASLGFVSYSQAKLNDKTVIWEVPENLHDPIKQQAILLTRATNKTAARHFLEFLKSDMATDIIISSGYSLE